MVFLNIIRANEKITQLETELEELYKTKEAKAPEALENELKDLKVKLESVVDNTQELVALKTEVENYKANETKTTAIVADYEKMSAEANDLHKQEMDNLTKQIVDLKSQFENKENNVNSRVAEEMASLGVPQDTIRADVAIAKPSTEQILETFSKLKGMEQVKFYNENKATILKHFNM